MFGYLLGDQKPNVKYMLKLFCMKTMHKKRGGFLIKFDCTCFKAGNVNALFKACACCCQKAFYEFSQKWP